MKKLHYPPSDYRTALRVSQIIRLQNRDTYPICPRCSSSLDREYQNYCDRCGQKLDWKFFNKAVPI